MKIMKSRCKNCGKTTQMELVDSVTKIPYLTQTYKCECGALRKIIYSVVESISYSPNGTKI